MIPQAANIFPAASTATWRTDAGGVCGSARGRDHSASGAGAARVGRWLIVRSNSVASPDPFIVCDCSLVRRAAGRACCNLRELRDALQTVTDAVLEHHLMHCALEDHFELYEFPNDLARWCWSCLGDQFLGEQLGLLDPYQQTTMAAVRETVLNALEERLWGLERVPWCRPGLELHLIESRLVTYDTGERIPTPAALAEAIERMSVRSLYYHVHEARRRSQGRTDDFSHWLELTGVEPQVVARFRAIDFYFLNLPQLRHELLQLFRQHLIDAPLAIRKT